MTGSPRFEYAGERFADIQMLRYRLNGFEELSLQQKLYIYYLSKATLAGRDITTDQFGMFNLRIRKMLEAAVSVLSDDDDRKEAEALVVYLKRVWFSNGIYHHYGCDKFVPGFSEAFLRQLLNKAHREALPLREGQSLESLCEELFPIIFDPDLYPKRVNKEEGKDLVLTSACNFYEGVPQQEAENFYADMARNDTTEAEGRPSYGLNSKLVKLADGRIVERKYTAGGLYGKAISRIVDYLSQARQYAENDKQKHIIDLLIKYYQTGDLHIFDEYSIKWLQESEGEVDFINGFIEVYGDPLGIKGSWEGLVEYKDHEGTRRTEAISSNAQWFEDHSPVDERFRKPKVKGVSAKVICAAMLGGDEYPSSAIGINLPNADWIRAEYGSKSVTIGNLTEAYSMAAHGNGFYDEFVIDKETKELIDRYGDICDDLHTDLHECLGHGSGRLLPGVSPDALGAYADTIEEARADLFALYYLADHKLLELGLLNDEKAYQSQYYTYMMNGLMTQLTRIQPGHQIEEAHMRNRALIARWTLRHCEGAAELVRRDGKTYLRVNDYEQLRRTFARLLAEIQRVKSEGDFEVAKALVEQYGVKVDKELHEEMLARYERLNISPYKGFINPRLLPVRDAEGNITDIKADYTESYSHQMLRYGKEYGLL